MLQFPEVAAHAAFGGEQMADQSATNAMRTQMELLTSDNEALTRRLEATLQKLEAQNGAHTKVPHCRPFPVTPTCSPTPFLAMQRCCHIVPLLWVGRCHRWTSTRVL